MGHPWDRDTPRHQSWASDTIVSAVTFVCLLIATVVTDILNGPAEPPAYLTGLLAASGMALFGAVGSDKKKGDKEVTDEIRRKADRADRRTMSLNEDIIRTEAKTDQIGREVQARHPDLDMPQPYVDLPPLLHDEGDADPVTRAGD